MKILPAEKQDVKTQTKRKLHEFMILEAYNILREYRAVLKKHPEMETYL